MKSILLFRWALFLFKQTHIVTVDDGWWEWRLKYWKALCTLHAFLYNLFLVQNLSVFFMYSFYKSTLTHMYFLNTVYIGYLANVRQQFGEKLQCISNDRDKWQVRWVGAKSLDYLFIKSFWFTPFSGVKDFFNEIMMWRRKNRVKCAT